MPETKRPLKVFLCHASADKPKVRELYRTLRRRGMQPWLDVEDLIPGQNWEVEIPKALLSSDAIIICLTPNSVDKEGYVQKEIKFALDKAMEMPEGRIFIIPARLEDCELPFALRQYQAVNLYEKAGYTKLMKALKLRASQLERATVELPTVGETNAEIKKVVEEKKSSELKQEKSENKTSKPSMQEVDIGGDASDSVIVTGSGNVNNVGIQETTAPEQPKPKKTKPHPKPNTAIIVALIGLAGTIIAALLSSPIIEKRFFPAPVSTEMVTATLTMTFQPKVPTKTIGPNQEPSGSITPSPISTERFIPTVTLLPAEFTDDKDVPMVLVPAGEFIMGSDQGNTDERPAHNVMLDAFYIDKYEVTIALYKLCMDMETCTAPAYMDFETANPNHPVSNVTWYQANDYCQWRGGRLPTEAEWEKSARGNDGRAYPWGEGVDCSYTNYGACGYRPVSVGSFEKDKSPYGVYDLGGNVEEWVADWYSLNYYSSPLENPTGPESGIERVGRGGSYAINNIHHLKSSNRIPHSLTYARWYLGFRCARDANP